MRPPFYDIMIVVLGQWGVFYKVVMILGEGMVVKDQHLAMST